MGDDAYSWKERPTDIQFRAQQKLYDVLVAKPRLAQFLEDEDSQKFVIRELTSILLNTFHVSNTGKIQTLMDFAKREGSGVFTPEDIALVEHTLGQLGTAKDTLSKLNMAEAQYRSEITATSGNDIKYNTPATFLTGDMASVFSPINPDLKAFKGKFGAVCDSHKKGKVGNTAYDKIASKLEITPADSKEVLQGKKDLGLNAIILGKYAEKGVESGVHIGLLLNDARDPQTKEVLEAVYKTLRDVVSGTFDTESPLSDDYQQCYELAQQALSETGKTRAALIQKLTRCMGAIAGVSSRRAFTSPAQPENVDSPNSPDNAPKIWSEWEEDYGERYKKRRDRRYIRHLTDKLSEDDPLTEADMERAPSKDAVIWRNGKAYVDPDYHWVLGRRGYKLEPIVDEANRVHGIIGDYASHTEIDKPLVKMYAKQLIQMLITKLLYDNALQKSQARYDESLANIDSLGLSDEAKADFISLPETLFDPVRQRRVASAVKNDARLQKFLFRHRLGGIYGSVSNGLDAPMAREMLRAIGIIPSKLYDNNDSWLSENKAADGSEPRLADLVSSSPDSRASARELLSQDPELIRSILGDYDPGDNEEDRKKLDSFLHTHDFLTRDELLSKHDPKFREANERLLRYASLLSDYDAEKGFTPEQRAALSETGKSWLNEWANFHDKYKAFKEYSDEWKKNGGGVRGTKWDAFVPQKWLIPDLLDFITKDIVSQNVVSRSDDDTDTSFADKFAVRYPGLDEETLEQIRTAPELSRLIDPDSFASNWYTTRARQYGEGDSNIEEDKAENTQEVGVYLTQRAFVEQNIPIKARVLIDRYMTQPETETPAKGEAEIMNARARNLKRIADMIRNHKNSKA